VKLRLGVVDLPYAHSGITTDDVAEILEAKYGVMGSFAEVHEQGIADHLANSMAGHLENMMMGAPAPVPSEDEAYERTLNRAGVTEGTGINEGPFLGAFSAIRHDFDQFITTEEIERQGIRGVPTQAALKGKSKRFKGGKNPAGRRPSFFDSGLYLSSFIAWLEGPL